MVNIVNISHSDLSEACRLKARPQKGLRPRASPPPFGKLPRKIHEKTLQV